MTTAARVLVAPLLLYALAALPLRPGGSATWMPIEPALVLAAMLCVPRRAERGLRALVVLGYGLLLALTTADWGTGLAFGRPFELARDYRLPVFGWNVFAHVVGYGLAVVALVAAIVVIALLLYLLFRGLAVWTRTAGPHRLRYAALVAALLIAPLTVSLTRSQTAAPVYERITRHAHQYLARRTERRALQRGLQTPAVDAGTDLARLAGKNVLFVFVESYGRTVFERALYAEAIGPRLRAFEHTIAAAGFRARSGWLTSPTVGGQSWLAHTTLLSGLWIDGQPRYEALIDSDRISLNRRFRQAGWRTAAVMPAITRAWPEAAWFGYDRVYASDDLGYEGEPFNWVTMPDQYTLAALQRAELDRASGQPVMIEAALISSHAPWVPIPPLLDWATIGDGTVFDDYARAGDPPVEVWKDPDQVRTQYLKAIDYSLATLASFVAERAHDDLVLVILGDHQPAPIITGSEASRDVPIHILSTDPAVLGAIDSWQWQTGMTPGAATPVWRMDAFYERFLRAFSGDVEPLPSSAAPPLRAE
ncbi:hypothetical protein S4A8_16467 [Salinisphaera sp. S4-8]|uniref:sulfatase-like hydrolase/transferase n=1 Tax=Salinisphaera sp. S4-8 TaxID=633357 RepID=UPI00333FA6BC